ncbi:MAG: cyclic nucleotide-binding domain-containing protein [Nannocystaceae bacterium]
MDEPTSIDVDAAVEALLQLPIGDALGRDKLGRLADVGRLVDVPAGAALFTPGDLAEVLHVVLAGRVSLTLEAPGRAPTTMVALSRGDVVGWSALASGAEGTRWTMTARATKPCRCLQIPGASLRELCERDHELGFRMMRYAFEVVAQRLEDSRVQYVDLYGETP